AGSKAAVPEFDDQLTAIKCPHCGDEDLYRWSTRSEHEYIPKSAGSWTWPRNRATTRNHKKPGGSGSTAALHSERPGPARSLAFLAATKGILGLAVGQVVIFDYLFGPAKWPRPV